jgi:hypothetical protein
LAQKNDYRLVGLLAISFSNFSRARILGWTDGIFFDSGTGSAHKIVVPTRIGQIKHAVRHGGSRKIPGLPNDTEKRNI